MLTRDEAARKVPSRKYMYQALIRNGYCVPKLKEKMMTNKVMRKIKEKKVWCPNTNQCQVNFKGCADPPPR